MCAEALSLFCAFLGTTAGNLALTLGAHGGVYIGGGIVPRLGDWFARSPFRARFESKGPQRKRGVPYHPADDRPAERLKLHARKEEGSAATTAGTERRVGDVPHAQDGWAG
jgi:hypothetical protein